MKQYFHNITNGIQTVFEGMSITLASMFVKGVTVQYPEVDVRSKEAQEATGYKGPIMAMPPNYRGILDVDMSICTGCLICMKACPIDCIVITNEKCDKETFFGRSGKKAVKTRACTRFDIDIGKCMFCGLCVEPCPTGAIFHTNEFEMNTTSLDALIRRYVTPEESVKIKARAIELEEENKKAKAAKELIKTQEAAAAKKEEE